MTLRGAGAVVEIGDDGTIESVLLPAGREKPDIDAPHLIVAPGFVDLQCNGGWGIDLTSEPERVWELATELPRHGVTSFLPTLVSCPTSVVERAAAALTSRPAGFAGAEPIGWHLEGPMLNPEYRGAHDEAMLRPSVWSGANRSVVALVTLAPELDGALDVVRKLTAGGVAVAAGHTGATAAQVESAIEAGLRGITHVFNVMRPFHHREVGPVGVAMTDGRVISGVIADGIHVAPRAVAMAFAAMGSRLALVTDSVAVTGSGGAVARLGPHGIHRAGDVVRDDRGVLAGSTLTMDRAVRNLMEFTGCNLREAVRAATEAPARLLGVERGRLEPGAPADVVLLTPEGEVVTTIAGGSIVYGEGAWLR